MAYCSLSEARSELNAIDTVDDDKVRRYITQVSRRIDGIMNPGPKRPYFEPFYEERQFAVLPNNVNSWEGVFYFNNPLLSITSIGIGTTDLTSITEGYPPIQSPMRGIRFTNPLQSWYGYCNGGGRYPQFISVTGLWGYNSDYARAWLNVDVVTTADVTPSATLVNVGNVSADDPNGYAPRFSEGQLVRFGTALEISEVVDTDAAGNTISLKRAVNGTPAATGNYTVGTALAVYQCDDVVRRIVARQAALLYARVGAFSVTEITDIGVTTYPSDLLGELRNTLNDYAYE